MGKYVGSWKIDDILYHKIQVSAATTGAATDADSVPTWRVYEDATTTPVTTGSYATFNSMTGFYAASITLAAAIGYEKGKNYYIRYSTTVASITGADVDCFQIEAEVDSNSVSVTATAHVSSMTAGAITATVITDGALTSAKFGAGFITAGSISDGSLTSAKFGAGFITAGSITDGALTGAKFGAGFITAGSFTAGAIGAGAISDGALTSAKFGAGFITAGSFSGNALAGMAVTVNGTAAAAIVDLVWDEPKAGHTTADTYGEYLDATLSGLGAAIGAVTVGATAAAAIADAVWGETAANYSTAGSMGFVLQDAQSLGAIVAGVWNATGAAYSAAGSFGGRLNVSVNSMTANAIGAVTVGSTAASAIAALVDSTTIAAIKAKTDLIFAGTTGTLKADIRFVNGVSVTGNGQSGTEWGPGS